MSNRGDDYEPDASRVQDRAIERQDDREDSVERMLGQADELLGNVKYPVTSEELAAEYGDQESDLANETESLGSVFDRLVDERFESEAEAREAIYGEITGEAGGPSEYNPERDLGEIEDAESDEISDASGN
jgi:hypothetical protein